MRVGTAEPWQPLSQSLKNGKAFERFPRGGKSLCMLKTSIKLTPLKKIRGGKCGGKF
jgi:hypothetical protein